MMLAERVIDYLAIFEGLAKRRELGAVGAAVLEQALTLRDLRRF